ncbi:hypothetical protein BH11ARM2_BH11ARM2_07770 [soil metagenome]
MTERELLIDGFAFDLWANRRWAEALTRHWPELLSPESMARMESPGPWPDFRKDDPVGRIGDVFVHVLWAQRTWLRRIGSEIAPAGDAEGWMRALNEGWVRLLAEHDLDAVIEYRNSRGQEGRLTVSEIARHVIDHGTYHRGQIREIYGSVAGEEFPETGLAGYFMTK